MVVTITGDTPAVATALGIVDDLGFLSRWEVHPFFPKSTMCTAELDDPRCTPFSSDSIKIQLGVAAP